MTVPDRRDAPAGLPAVVSTGRALAHVPVQLQEIAEAAGQDAALKLVENVGGSEVLIPRRAGPDHWLTGVVGPEAAEKICAHYRVTDADGREVGNVKIYVPLLGTSARDLLRQQVRDDVAAGMTVRAAARRARVSERTASRAVGELARAKDKRQGELF